MIAIAGRQPARPRLALKVFHAAVGWVAGLVAVTVVAVIAGAIGVPILRSVYGVNLDHATSAMAVFVGSLIVVGRAVLAAITRWSGRPVEREAPKHPFRDFPLSVVITGLMVLVALMIAYLTVASALSAAFFAQIPQLSWARDLAIGMMQWLAITAFAMFSGAVLGIIANAVRRRLFSLGSDLHEAFTELATLVSLELERCARSRLAL